MGKIPENPARYRRLMSLFDRALALPVAERSAWIEQLGSEHPSFADELRQLLDVDGTRHDIFDSLAGRLDIGLAHAPDVFAAPCDSNTDPRDPLIGTELGGRYRLDERLGTGGMGRVYRAFDRIEERTVAVKILRSELAGDLRQVQRFRREFRAVSRLAHPGCITMFDEGCHHDQRYIVMEYMAGGSLERMVHGSPKDLLPILITLAETLDAVHESRILHRDLKPANVLLVPGPVIRPKLADFGIVHLADDEAGRLTDTGAVLGSIDFMSPEQVEGKPLDCRCDLYSFGCVMYWLWTGNPPFQGPPLQRLRKRFDVEAPSLREQTPEAPLRLDALVARLLRRDRAERPASAREVARELRAILEEMQGADALRTTRENTLPVSARDPQSVEQIADALLVAGRPQEVVAILRQYKMTGRPAAMQARWLRKMGIAYLRTSDVAEGLSALEQALALLGDAVPPRKTSRRLRMLKNLSAVALRSIWGGGAIAPVDVERALIHHELAMIHRWIDIERAAYHHLAFTRLAFRLGIDTYRTTAYLGIAFISSIRPWPKMASMYYEKASNLALSTGDTSGLARYEIVRGGVETSIGRDPRVAMEHFGQGVRLAESVGDDFLTTFALAMRGWAAMLLSYPAQAHDDFQRAMDLATHSNIPWLHNDAACGLSLTELYRGEFAAAVARMHLVLASKMRLAMPVFEALPTEILGVEAFLTGRYREAIASLDRARTLYLTHGLYRGWGTFAKLVPSEVLVCWVDEAGPDVVPDLLQRLRDNARTARRMSRLWVFRGYGSFLAGLYRARRGHQKAARRLFDRALAERGNDEQPSFMDLGFRVRIAIERLRMGDSKESITRDLDEARLVMTQSGFLGMLPWLERLRGVHGI